MAKSEAETFAKQSLENADIPLKELIYGLAEGEVGVTEVQKVLSAILTEDFSPQIKKFNMGLLCRFLFSALVDADRMSAAARRESPKADWGACLLCLEKKFAEFNQDSEVNRIRHSISAACRDFAHEQKGMYRLTVPTGGGKTLASLRYALMHAKYHNMDRIIYVIPYTSIIEQNAQEVREILESEGGPSIVLEHHSNVIDPAEIEERQVLAENWDAPIIFTTSVQFLNALFDGSTTSSRRMHRLANAVVVFDEIQTLPIKTVHIFNIAANFLVRFCQSTMVMCSATLPLLDTVCEEKGALLFTKTEAGCEMAPSEMNLFSKLKRVEVVDGCKPKGWGEDELASLIVEQGAAHKNVLVVTNTRKWAKTLYEKCVHRFDATYHLSAAMCPAHRSDVLDIVKERIHPAKQKPTICISTQLIEAGVDVDFNAGIRFLAGLDSIAQAAGRVNRNGRHKICRMTIINPYEEQIVNLRDIRIGKEVAGRVLREFKDAPDRFDNDILSPKLMELYYEYYFHKRSDEMVYRIKSGSTLGRDDSLLSLLSNNSASIAEYKQSRNGVPKLGLRQSFKTAGRLFCPLDAPTASVVVPYGEEGKEVIIELCKQHFDPEKRRRIVRRAQRYCVSLYPHEIRRLSEQQAIFETYPESGIFHLDERYYSQELGVVLESSAPMPTLIT